MALNSIGDQGVINFGAGAVKGPPVSIARNFALNVTDNNSAPLQDRIIPLEYHRFFNSNRVYPGLNFVPSRFAETIVPSQTSSTRVRTQDDRYVFGFEAIVAPRVSILVRQSVVSIKFPEPTIRQVTTIPSFRGAPSGVITPRQSGTGIRRSALTLQQGTTLTTLSGLRSGFGDLQITPKFLLHQDETLIATTGFGMILPVGSNDPYQQFGNSAFVLEPFILLMAKPTDRLVLQAGFEYDIPIAQNLEHVSLIRYMLFAAYNVYDDPSSELIRQVFPLVELHGSNLVGGFTQDTVNLTFGVRVNVFRQSQFGIGYSLPVTQDRQFSNEFLLNYNIFF